MLKASALEQVGEISRLFSAIELKGDWAPLQPTIDEARVTLDEALKAGTSEDLAKALGRVAVAMEKVRDGTGAGGFGKVADRARFLSLLFLGFALNGQARKGKGKGAG